MTSLLAALQEYTSTYPEELDFRERFIELLRHPRAFHRDHLPGHITGSAWITDNSGKSVLLTHHAKLNKWLQPGGHADGDENVLRVALREAEEETGLTDFQLLKEGIFDLDIHTIPARKDFPEHLHFDVRFLFKADASAELLITEESHDLRWVAIGSLPELTQNNISISRMALKQQALLLGSYQQ